MNNSKLLSELAGVPEALRTARFRCVLVLEDPTGFIKPSGMLWDGRCEGSIAFEPSGAGGFGYDPLFIPENETRSMAELSPSEKDQISHRGLATREMAEFLRSQLHSEVPET